MDAVRGLVQIGFTEYEARVYLSLLTHSEGSGYEISRLSGVPRSKVYEILESLVRRGVASSLTQDGKQIYQPLPYELLLSRHEQETAGVLASLSSSLGQLSVKQSNNTVSSLSGYEPSLQRVRELCQLAKVRLLVAGLPADLVQIIPELVEADSRGVKVFVLSYGECSIPLENVFIHVISPLQYLQVAVIGRWLGVVADYQEAMLVVAGAQTLGIWGSNKGLVHALGLWIQHDIHLNESARYLGPEVIDKIPKDVQQKLQDMVVVHPSEMGGGPVLPGIAPAQKLLAEIAERITAHPLGYQHVIGDYGLVLHGNGGGNFTLRVSPTGATLTEGLQQHGLSLEMSAQDFVALVRGTLPLLAFMELGRVKITGHLALASNLQLIFRG